MSFFHGLNNRPYNLLLNRTLYDTPEGREKLCALLQTYCEGGGFQVQISVVGRETLLAAQQEPEKYADLMVKVGGYSDYFVTLSAELQEALVAKQ